MPRGLMRSAALDSANLGWAATAAALVAIGGVTLPASALLAVVLLAQASIGDRAMRRVRWWAETEWHERLLLRIVAGAVVATAVDQVARALLGPGTVASAAWWIVALAASVTSRPAAAASPAADGAPPTDWAPPWRQWIWLALVACVIVAHEVLWTVETAIALGLLGTAASDSIRLPARGAEPWRTLRQPVAVRGVLVAAAVAVAWWGIDRRPPVRLLPDDRFFARVVWSLGEWGWTSNPFAIGEPFRYHWGSYAWLGLLARSSGAGAEASIRTVGPMAVAIVVALGLVALARRCGVPAGAALVAAGIAAACDTYAITGRGRGFHIGWVESFSQLASIPFVILAVLVLARIDERPRVGDGLIVGVLVLAAGAVKVSAAAVIVAAVCGSVAWAAWRRRRIDGPPFAAAAGAVIAGAIAAWRFSEPVGNTALGSGIVRPYWPVGFIGDLWRWYVDSLAKWTVVMVLLLAALVVAIPLASAGMRSLADRAHARASGATLLAGSAAGLALTVLMPPSDNPFYALQNVVVIAWIVVAVGVVDGAADAASAPRGSLRAAAGVGAGVVVGLVTVLGDLERSDPDQILWIYVARPAIPALTAAILAIPLIARHRRIDGVVLRPVMLLLTGASVTLGLLNWRDQRSSDYREWARASAVAPDPAETDLLEWIAMTPPETVVASASDVVRDPMPRRELVPLVTTIQGYGREPLQRASVAAASGPGCVAASELVAAGADVFVATTEEASVGALDACATRVYENASYVVYDLAKAP